MDRRAFLRRAAFVAAGAVAADQLDVLERIGWTRRLFAGFGAGVPTLYGDGIRDDAHALQSLVDGRRVRYRGDLLQREHGFVVLPRASYSISKPIHVGADVQSFVGNDSRVIASRSMPYMLHFSGDGGPLPRVMGFHLYADA